MREAAVIAALDRCYAALVDDDRWTEALDRLAHSVGAQGCSFVNQAPPSQRPYLPASPRYQEFVRDFVAEGWAENDHRARRGWPKLRGGGKVLIEHDVSSDEERHSLPVYRDLYARHDLSWWATVSFMADSDLWALSFLRSKSAGPFSRAEANGLKVLAPDLARLLRLRTAMARSRAKDLVQVLDAIDCAAMVVDHGLALVAMNQAAEACLGPDLDIKGGRLVASGAEAERALHQLRTQLQDAGAQHPQPIVVQREGATRPLLMDIIPGRRAPGSSTLDQHALLIFRDLRREQQTDGQRMRRIFGLTGKEALFAERLAAGDTVQTAADQLGMARETARSHLKSLFAKTGSNRQVDLISLLWQSGGHLR